MALQVQNCFFRSISVIISNKILLFQQEGMGERQAPPVGSDLFVKVPQPGDSEVTFSVFE